ncbi:MAG: fibronectin type III domain-containing protein [Melioribacteraceae bacterium]
MKNKLTIFAIVLILFSSLIVAQTPADLSTGISVTTNFSFTAVAVPPVTHLQVSTANDFSALVLDYNLANTDASYTFNAADLIGSLLGKSGFNYGSTYYWRIYNITGSAVVEPIGAPFYYTFTTLQVAPTLTSPTLYQVGVSVLPTLTWDVVPGATSYSMEISTNSDHSSPIVISPVYASPAVTHTFTYVTTASTILTNGTTYYWRVNATTPAGTSAWANGEFTTVNAAKPTINPVYPGVTSAYIGWYPVPYSSGLKYDVLRSVNANMNGYTVVASDLTNTYYTTTGLAQATDYYIQVRAHNSAGTIMISYSTVYGPFHTATPPIPNPSYPTDPLADGSIYANPPTLFWWIDGNEPGLDYDIQYRLDEGGAAWPTVNPVTTITGTSNKTFKTLTGGTFTAGSTYQWRVRSKSGVTTSNWSTVVSFTMYSNVALSPIVPTPSWPVGNPTVYFNPPTLYWYLGSDKTGLYYEVELSADGLDGGAGTNFTTPIVVAGKSQDLFKALTSTLIPGHTYYWHVRSDLNDSPGGESAWSTNGSFTIASSASGAATTPIPSWPVGGAIVDGTMADITLSWTAYSTQALDFKVRMATSPSVDGSGMLNHGSAHELLGWVPTVTSANATAVFGTLTAGATYYWQVMSELNGNTSVKSPWSMVASFSTAAGSSSVVPLVISPNYGQPINNTSAVLTWKIPVPTDSHLKYDLQYSKNSDFSSAQTKANLNEPVAQVTGLDQNSTYYWRVLSKTDNGSTSSYSTTGSFKTSGATAVEEQETIPTAYELSQNYPNPFNPTTRINFAIPQNSFVTIKVYDMLGREVKTLINQQMVSGNHSIDWNADNNLGIKVATGMYIYRITAGNFVSTKKMVLIK